nr:caffeoylshikimate esterase-like [Ipomoea batatas]GME16023.1 caffeoylshikimate esterase-like [Ipomoea batatas]
MVARHAIGRVSRWLGTSRDTLGHGLTRGWMKNLKGANNKRQKQSSVLEFFQENCSKIKSVVVGPDGGAGIGCSVGVGLGGVAGIWCGVRVGLVGGVGLGGDTGIWCSVGVGLVGAHRRAHRKARVCGMRHRLPGPRLHRWGLKAHILDINPVIDDCVAFFDSFRDRHVPLDLPSFLYAESLGGAIALLITLHRVDSTTKQLFDGIF